MLHYTSRLGNLLAAHSGRGSKSHRAPRKLRDLRFEALDPRLLLTADPIVTFNTSFGSFQVELFADAAPQTVANFLKYVNAGEYSNTIIHRTVNVNPGGIGIVQGGGFSASSVPFPPAPPHIDTSLTPTDSLPLESTLANTAGTIAMARTSDPNSGSSEFFFNTVDNSAGLPAGASGGYTVFGQVLGNGLSVLQAINAQQTLNGYFPSYSGSSGDPNNLLGPMPLVNFDPNTATEIDANNLIIVNSVALASGSFSGTIFNDQDGNGQINGPDAGLVGFTVYIDANDNGQIDAGEASTVTDSSGNYSFNVAPGSYVVRVAPQASWTQTSPVNATPAFGAQRFTLQSNQSLTGENFGFNFVITAPDRPTLSSDFDTGLLNNDGNTNLSSLQFVVTGVQSGATVTLRDGQNVIGSAVAQGTSVTITPAATFADGSHSITATQSLFGQTSTASLARSVIVKTTPPIISSTPPADAVVGTQYIYNISGSSDVVAFSLLNPPAGMVTPTLSAPLTWTPTENQIGNQSVTLVATDVFGNTAQQTINIAVNGPPFFPPIPKQQINQGSQLSLTPVVKDLDPLTYSLGDGAPAGASIDPTTGLFTWQPASGTPAGAFAITINAVDPGGLGASQVLNVTVNAPPVVGVINNQTVNERATLSFQVPATDQDALTYQLLGNPPAGATVDPSGLFTWTPTEAQGGVIYHLTVRVTDTGGLSVDQAFQVTVNKIDSPPVIASISAINVIRGQTVSFVANGTDTDLPFAGITYSLDPGAPADAIIDPDTGAFTWQVPSNFALGTTTISVRVTDKTANAFNAATAVQIVVGDVPVTPPPTSGNGNRGGTGIGSGGGSESGSGHIDDETLSAILSNPGVAALVGSQANALNIIPTIPTGPAVLQQLAKTALDRAVVGRNDTGGRLPSGIVDFVIGSDTGLPQVEELRARELAAFGEQSSGDGAPDKHPDGEVQKAGNLEPIDNPGANNQQPPPRAPVHRTSTGKGDQQNEVKIQIKPQTESWPTAESFKAEVRKAHALQARLAEQGGPGSSTAVSSAARKSADAREERSTDRSGERKSGKRAVAMSAAMIPLLIGQLEAREKLAERNRQARSRSAAKPNGRGKSPRSR